MLALASKMVTDNLGLAWSEWCDARDLSPNPLIRVRWRESLSCPVKGCERIALELGFAGRSGRLRGLVSRVRLRFRRSLAASSPPSGPAGLTLVPSRPSREACSRRSRHNVSVFEVGDERWGQPVAVGSC
jgi:hypothetical protein